MNAEQILQVIHNLLEEVQDAEKSEFTQYQQSLEPVARQHSLARLEACASQAASRRYRRERVFDLK